MAREKQRAPADPGRTGTAKTDPAELRAQIEAEQDPVRKGELALELATSRLRANPPEAGELAEQALALGRAAGAERVTCRALGLIAEVNFIRGNFAEAGGPCQESLELAVRTGDTYAEHKATNILGQLAMQSGEREQAVQLLEQSLTAAQKLNDDQAMARVYTSLGRLYRGAGELDKSLDYHFKALHLNEQRNDGNWIAVSRLNIGAAYGDMGDWEKAIEYFYRAVVEFEEIGDKRGMATCYINIAEIYVKRGKYERAMQSAELAAQCAEDAHTPMLRIAAMGVLGNACIMADNLLRARTIFDENIKAAEELGLRRELISNIKNRAEVSLESKDPTEAVELLEKALAMVESSGPAQLKAGVLAKLAVALADSGQPQRAEQHYESALDLLESLNTPFELAKVSFDYGQFLASHGRRDEGIARAEEAAKTFKRLEMLMDSEAAERFLFQMSSEPDRKLSLLRSLSALAAHSLPLPEFAPRCLDLLKEGLGFSTGTFVAGEGRPFVAGSPCSEEDLAACRRGELVMSASSLCLPMRLSGRTVGGVALRRAGGESGQRPETGMDASFLEIVSNLLSVAMERNRTPAGVVAAGPAAPELAGTAPPRYPGFIGNCEVLQEIYATIEQVAPTNACVLVRGESGTGKDMLARIIAQRSPRSNEPFVAINCAAMPETLVESELFGIEKGVATGVVERKGKFEQADRGTLFLDEIGDMSLVLQSKLLRVLQDHRFERVGGRKTIEVDVRVVVATNRDLDKAIAAGQFREDLYYRLNVITIALPPLRERKEDIPLLVNHFVALYNEEFQRRLRGVTTDVLETFLNFNWPGNVRELKNVVERAVILCRSDLIQLSDLPLSFRPRADAAKPISSMKDMKELRKRTRQSAGAILERNMIASALKESKGNVAKAARQLGVSRSHFYRLLREHGLQNP
jgi:DNA-binding NtrC family response regulator/tetratricopeptide (TPR) repeat protein